MIKLGVQAASQGLIMACWACDDIQKGRARTEAKSTGEKPLHDVDRVPRCQSFRKPISSEVNQTVGRNMGPGTPERSPLPWRRAGILDQELMDWAE